MSASAILRTRILRSPVPRRALTVTLLLVTAAICVVLIPVACIPAGIVALRPGGRGRPLRLAGFLAAYLAVEIAAIAGSIAIRVRGKAGQVVAGRALSEQACQESNHALMAGLLRRLYAAATRLYGLRVSIPVQDPTLTMARRSGQAVSALPDGPLIVLSRHGGPGDSFLLIHALLNHADRRPRVVLKDTLMFDPAIDILLSRVPHSFVNPNPVDGDDVAAKIGRLAEGMKQRDVLVIFPEGGKFTLRRRIRAIAKLRKRGLRTSVNRAIRLRHVLPPRPAGVFAAIDACPSADVVFVAHTGLDHMESVAAVWRSIPLVEPLEATWWTVPAARVPVGEKQRLEWLQDNWAEVDTWIDRHRPETKAVPRQMAPEPAAPTMEPATLDIAQSTDL